MTDKSDKIFKRLPLISSLKKETCPHCHNKLSRDIISLYLCSIKHLSYKVVSESVYYCTTCRFYFTSLEINKRISTKYPGYFVETAIYSRSTNSYDVFTDKPRNKSMKTKREQTSKCTPSLPSNQSAKEEPCHRDSVVSKISTSVSPRILLTNANIESNDCPACSGVLITRRVNIPVIDRNGDFVHYYVSDAKYCLSCKQYYITTHDALLILARIEHPSKKQLSIELSNVSIRRSQYCNDYLFCPTIQNDYLVYDPNRNPSRTFTPLTIDNPFNFAQSSFLFKMGYRVSVADGTRHRILLSAIEQYGKRKVTDLLCSLIATRKNRYDEFGNAFYSNALGIWQDDLNFIMSIADSY